VPSPLPRAPVLGTPLRPRPAHVVQLRPVGGEQGVPEGAEQPRSAAMEESVDLWIHVSGPSAFPPWSRFDKSRFCLSASNICALKPGCLGAALRANSLGCGRVRAREAGASAAMRRGDSAAGRSRRFFGPDESSSEVSNVANRYSSAIWMKRARRSVVSALRASSKQHSAKPSNCLVKVAFIARQQRWRVEEVPSERTVLPALKPERIWYGFVGLEITVT